MNQDLVDEINYLIDLLTKSGFFSKEEILEILEEQFIEYDIDFSKFNISLNNFNNTNFSILEETFKKLTRKSIICVHNCGYDFEEGVEDIYELYFHLVNNNYSAEGFCFYTFEDLEQAIEDENKSLEIGNIVYQYLLDADFDVNWDKTVNSPIEIVNFKWDKKFDENMEYELEGAYELFVGENNEK